MKKKVILIIIFLAIFLIAFSQEQCLNKIYVSYDHLFLNYKFLPIKDNFTNQLTEHKYSKSYNYSLNIGIMKYKKLNYGLFMNYSSLGYQLNYKFVTFEYDPYLLKYSIIYVKYFGIGVIIGKSIINKNTIKLNSTAYIQNNYLIQNINMHVFNNKEHTKSKDILYPQQIKKYIPLIGLNLEIEKKILAHTYISVGPSIFYFLKKISDVSLEKNKINYSISIKLAYEL